VAEHREPRTRARRKPRIPGVSDLLDVSDEMIAFVEKYQQVWEHESKATFGLAAFLGERAESMRVQAELMRMGSDTFRRYTAWSESLMNLRPDVLVQSWMREMDRFRTEGKQPTGGTEE
jgi:hypothetical protein